MVLSLFFGFASQHLCRLSTLLFVPSYIYVVLVSATFFQYRLCCPAIHGSTVHQIDVFTSHFERFYQTYHIPYLSYHRYTKHYSKPAQLRTHSYGDNTPKPSCFSFFVPFELILPFPISMSLTFSMHLILFIIMSSNSSY